MHFMASQAEDSQLQQDEESQLQEETQDSQAGGATLPILKDGKRLHRAYENVLRNPELGKLLDKWVAGQEEEARRKATSKPASKPSSSSADPTPRRSSKRGIDSNAKEKESTPSSSSSSFPQSMKERVTIDLTK